MFGRLRYTRHETAHVAGCTHGYMIELVAIDGVVIGRHFLFVSSLKTHIVEEFIRDRLRRLDGDTWTELAQKVARIGLWEFEDYTPRR